MAAPLRRLSREKSSENCMELEATSVGLTVAQVYDFSVSDPNYPARFRAWQWVT